MTTNLYVGNLSFTTTTSDLETLFGKHGQVTRAQVVSDRDTNRSRGFGFVEMASAEDARKAIDALDGSDQDGRRIKVNVAKERSR